MKFDGTIGPAFLAAVVAGLANIGIMLWSGGALKQSVTDQFEAATVRFNTLTDQVTKVATSSNKRFETVHTELAAAKNAQSDENGRIGKVETAISYISNQIMRVEAKLDGGPPAPALPAPTKP